MKRLFIAIKINPEEKLLNEYAKIKALLSHSGIKWVDPALFHFTIKFLGDTNEEKTDVLKNIMLNIAGNYEPFDIQLKGLGVFGSRYNPRVIWIGLHNTGILKKMTLDFIEELDKFGFKKDRQNIVPHLTIGRIKYIRDKYVLKNIVERYSETLFQTTNIENVILYESILKKSGPAYNELFKVKLN